MKYWLRLVLPLVIPTVFLVVVVAGFWVGFSLVLERTPKTCDEVVHTLMTTQDWVELRRAIFLVHRLDCSLKRRLP